MSNNTWRHVGSLVARTLRRRAGLPDPGNPQGRRGDPIPGSPKGRGGDPVLGSPSGGGACERSHGVVPGGYLYGERVWRGDSRVQALCYHCFYS